MQNTLLGDIKFELLSCFQGLSGKHAANYAEHALIEGKPRLQYVGQALIEYSAELKFHASFCDPDAELDKLLAAQSAHVSLPFVLGTGEHKGYFIIAEINSTVKRTTTLGRTLSLIVSMTLREDAYPESVAAGAPAVVSAGVRPPLSRRGVLDLRKPNLPDSLLRDAVIAGRAVAGAVRAANNMVALARKMQSSPLEAIAQLGPAAASLGRAAQAAGLMGAKLGPLQAVLKDAAPVLDMAGAVATAAGSTSTLLGGVNAGNLPATIDSATLSLDAIDRAMQAAAPSLARLSAKSAVRSPV